MKKFVKVLAGSVWALPVLALAQQADVGYLDSLIGGGKFLLDQLVVFLVALSVVWFIFNVIRYTMSSDEDKKSQAKSQMIWGIVAIAVIVSVWGLVGLLQNMFGVQDNNTAGDVGGLLPQN